MNEFDWTHALAHAAIAFLVGIGGYKRGARDKQRLVDTAFENGVRVGIDEEKTKQKSMAKFVAESPWL